MCKNELLPELRQSDRLNMWNSLPGYVVMSDTINTFKNRLDAHWKHRDFCFIIVQPKPEPEIRIYV